jgi:hypothetical protein
MYEGQYLISFCSTPIIYRFVADTVDVPSFDALFCEGLGARIGLEVCEPLTQSTAKKQAIASEYQKFINLAKAQNAILEGADEPALDDWIACRR